MATIPQNRKRKILVYLLCLLAAVIVWLAVMAVSPPQREVKYTDIPVKLEYYDGFSASGYTVDSYTEHVSARLSATREEHMDVKGTMRAVATVSPSACEYALIYDDGILSLNVTFEDESGTVFVPREPVSITVHVIAEP